MRPVKTLTISYTSYYQLAEDLERSAILHCPRCGAFYALLSSLNNYGAANSACPHCAATSKKEIVVFASKDKEVRTA